MQLAEMYNGAVNSLEANLTTAITATDTELTVSAAEAIPDPPNLLVIGGNAADAETVKLTAKNGNVLTVERGFQGTAKEWDVDENGVGAVISRNFTEYDHAAFIFNITGVNAQLEVLGDRLFSSACLGASYLGNSYLGG